MKRLNKDLRDLDRVFAEGMEKLVVKHPFLRVDVDWQTGIAILACLQLSLRHPGNVGHSATCARQFIDLIIASVAEVDPPLADLLRRGDDPNSDEPR